MFRIDRRFFKNFDWVLLTLLVMVCGMAFLNLYSATYPSAGGMPPHLKQCYLLLMGVAGIIFMVSLIIKNWCGIICLCAGYFGAGAGYFCR